MQRGDGEPLPGPVGVEGVAVADALLLREGAEGLGLFLLCEWHRRQGAQHQICPQGRTQKLPIGQPAHAVGAEGQGWR